MEDGRETARSRTAGHEDFIIALLGYPDLRSYVGTGAMPFLGELSSKC